jgi:hypothetical protein
MYSTKSVFLGFILASITFFGVDSLQASSDHSLGVKQDQIARRGGGGWGVRGGGFRGSGGFRGGYFGGGRHFGGFRGHYFQNFGHRGFQHFNRHQHRGFDFWGSPSWDSGLGYWGDLGYWDNYPSYYYGGYPYSGGYQDYDSSYYAIPSTNYYYSMPSTIYYYDTSTAQPYYDYYYVPYYYGQ